MASMNNPTHVPKMAWSVSGIHGPNSTLEPGVKWRYIVMVPPVIVPPIIVPSILSLSPWARTNDGKRCNTEANTRKDIVVVFVMMVGRDCAWESGGSFVEGRQRVSHVPAERTVGDWLGKGEGGVQDTSLMTGGTIEQSYAK